MSAPEAVTPVTLWRGDHYEGNSFFLSESKHQRREEWKALPAAQYAELVAYAKTGEAVEGVLIEANEDDGTMTPADVVRALVAERDALRADLADLASGRVDIHELIVRNGKIDAAFGGEMVQEIGLVFVDAYRKAGAVNYLEMTFHGKTEAGELERFTMTIQRVNGKTPHECRVEAERERDAARTALGAERA